MIRLATSHDAADVARLMIGFRDWWSRTEPPDAAFHGGVRRVLADPNSDFLLAGDPPAGMCQLRYRYSIWTESDDCWLEDIFVEEAARGSGMGRELMDAAFARARERGCRRMELDVNEANAAALALYESLGFSARSDPPGGRNLLMRRRL
ncbi:MAG TPA: GNAT family N-acetyltransferase [Thermoleophilaceae bacterium]|nr:GNAT family N-acetyltransferase [Thermoleophilaceae bacterium]